VSTLWSSDARAEWDAALARYPEVIARQGVARLPELDRWYREDLPEAMAVRTPVRCTHDELVRVTEWKMARGVWRGRNLALVRGNDAARVEEVSAAALAGALAAEPHPTKPIAALAELDGVGPATASAVAAAAAPATYPFFDEIVAACVPDLGAVAFTLPYYGRYAEALRERARRLGGGWTPVMVERALWASRGGKAGMA
jgi:hypothetical protein